MPWVETNRSDIVNRLERESWVCEGGAKHDKFSHPNHLHKIMVPRHCAIALSTARSIAKAAGWL